MAFVPFSSMSGSVPISLAVTVHTKELPFGQEMVGDRLEISELGQHPMSYYDKKAITAQKLVIAKRERGVLTFSGRLLQEKHFLDIDKFARLDAIDIETAARIGAFRTSAIP